MNDMNRAQKDVVQRARLSRREFALTAAIAAASAATLPSALAQEDKSTPAPSAAPKEPQLPAASRAEADAAMQAILGRYGSRFSEAQKAELHRLVFQQQDGLDKLRAFALENSNEPATAFRPYRAEGGK